MFSEIIVTFFFLLIQNKFISWISFTGSVVSDLSSVVKVKFKYLVYVLCAHAEKTKLADLKERKLFISFFTRHCCTKWKKYHRIKKKKKQYFIKRMLAVFVNVFGTKENSCTSNNRETRCCKIFFTPCQTEGAAKTSHLVEHLKALLLLCHIKVWNGRTCYQMLRTVSHYITQMHVEIRRIH